MGSPLKRIATLGLISFIVSVSPQRAEAQFAVSALYTITEDGATLTSETDNDFFNIAQCYCDENITLRISYTGAGTSNSGKFWVWAGTSCDGDEGTVKEESCIELKGQTALNTLANSDTSYNLVTVKASQLMTTNGGSCTGGQDTDYKIWIFTDEAATGSFEPMTITGHDGYPVDTTAPDAPLAVSGVLPVCGEGKMTLEFASSSSSTSTADGGTSNTTTDPEIKGYQILCQKWNSTTGTGSAPKLNKTPEFSSTKDICQTASDGLSAQEAGEEDGGVIDGAASDTTFDAGAIDSSIDTVPPADATVDATVDSTVDSTVDAISTDSTTDGGTTTSTGQASLLAEANVCSSIINSAGSVSIDGLENGQLYKFWVVAIDNAGNPSEPKELGEGTPCLEEDFEERYGRQGGNGVGCYNCAISDSRSPWLDLSLLLMAVALWRWRRKRRPKHRPKNQAPTVKTGGGAA